MRYTTTFPQWRTNATSPCPTSMLLNPRFSSTACNLTSCFCTSRPLPLVCFVHSDRISQQFITNRSAELLIIQLQVIYFFPLFTLPGSVLEPIEPGGLCRVDPWVCAPPLKFHLFITPANPFPLVIPTTSTCLTSANISTVIFCPNLISALASGFTSLTNLFGSCETFAALPISCFVAFFFFLSSNPSLIAE